MKYIYLIQSLENSYYKIGVSKHPQVRLKQHQTGNPSATKLIEVYETNYAYRIEKALHRRFSHVRKEGEWFDLSISIEVSFKSDCQKIQDNIIFLEKKGNVFI